MTIWNYGCDKLIEVWLQRGYNYKMFMVRCGSTAHDGGVNQCEACERKYPTPPVPEYGDDDGDYSKEGDEW